MTRETPRNLAASVRQRLFNRAQERHEEFGLVLTKYGLERFLYRLAHSQYRDQFVLKGALLFELWTHHPYRPTRDLDLEGQGDNSIARIKQVFAEIIGQPVEDDGFIFDLKSLRVARIKEDQEYEGLEPGEYFSRLEQLVRGQGITLEYSAEIAPAKGMSCGKKIILLPGMAPAEQFSTLVHGCTQLHPNSVVINFRISE